MIRFLTPVINEVYSDKTFVLIGRSSIDNIPEYEPIRVDSLGEALINYDGELLEAYMSAYHNGNTEVYLSRIDPTKVTDNVSHEEEFRSAFELIADRSINAIGILGVDYNTNNGQFATMLSDLCEAKSERGMPTIGIISAGTAPIATATETLTLYKHGELKLNHPPIKGTVTITDETGSLPYYPDNDVDIEYNSGFIRRSYSTSLDTIETVKITYSYINVEQHIDNLLNNKVKSPFLSIPCYEGELNSNYALNPVASYMATLSATPMSEGVVNNRIKLSSIKYDLRDDRTMTENFTLSGDGEITLKRIPKEVIEFTGIGVTYSVEDGVMLYSVASGEVDVSITYKYSEYETLKQRGFVVLKERTRHDGYGIYSAVTRVDDKSSYQLISNRRVANEALRRIHSNSAELASTVLNGKVKLEKAITESLDSLISDRLVTDYTYQYEVYYQKQIEFDGEMIDVNGYVLDLSLTIVPTPTLQEINCNVRMIT